MTRRPNNIAVRRLLPVALAIALALPAARAEEGEAAPPPARANPKELLDRAFAVDPDTRLRARRALHAAVLDHLRRSAPTGMTLIPGTVEIGAKGVVLKGGFYLARQETTAAKYNEWRKALKETLRVGTDGDVPVAGVSLRDARAYARWRKARLPTREELELAATARGRLRYPWGDTARAQCANTREAGLGAAERAGSRAAGRSPHGILDLLGNVAEWTETPVSPRGSAKRPRRARPAKPRKYLVVGGSFKHGLRRPRTRAFVTYRIEAAQTLPDVGFRLAASLPALPAAYHRG